MASRYIPASLSTIPLLLLAGVIALLPDAAHTAAPIEQRIVYDSSDGIMSITPDGTDPVVLVPGEGEDSYARISPDGSKIAFVRAIDVGGYDPNYEIFVMNADGSNQVNLTKDPAGDYAPSWSPDGTQIAFMSDRAGDQGFDFEIWLMDAEGANPFRVTTTPWHTAAREPAWSPDGDWIAYSRASDAPVGQYWPNHVFVIPPDGGQPVDTMPGVEAFVYSPAWSPDGSRIAVSTAQASASSSGGTIWEMTYPGGEWTQRTQGEARSPRYSPDGKSIVFVSSRDVNDDIYKVDEAGTETQLTSGLSYDHSPDWGMTGGAGMGDVDGNGTRDAQDVSMTVRSLAGAGNIMYPQFADVDCDGDVDIRDVLWMLWMVAGLGAPDC
jgi:TolB protein